MSKTIEKMESDNVFLVKRQTEFINQIIKKGGENVTVKKMISKMDILEQIFHNHSLKLVDMDNLLKTITKDTLIHCGKSDENGNSITYTLTKDYVRGYRDSYEKLRKEIEEKIIKKSMSKI